LFDCSYTIFFLLGKYDSTPRVGLKVDLDLKIGLVYSLE